MSMVGELHGRLAPGEVSLGALAHELRFGLECDDLPELQSAERTGEEAHGPVEVLLRGGGPNSHETLAKPYAPVVHG